MLLFKNFIALSRFPSDLQGAAREMTPEDQQQTKHITMTLLAYRARVATE